MAARLAVVVLLSAVAAACGGSDDATFERDSVRDCIGDEGPAGTRVAASDYTRGDPGPVHEGTVVAVFAPGASGEANQLTLLFASSADDAERLLGDVRRSFASHAVKTRRANVVVDWQSTPTGEQEAALDVCVPD